MTVDDQPELSRLLRKIPRQHSPEHLDDDILGAAASLAPRRQRQRLHGWTALLATACIAIAAVVVVDPLQHDRIAPPHPRPQEQTPVAADSAAESISHSPVAEETATAENTANRYNVIQVPTAPSRIPPEPVNQISDVVKKAKKMELQRGEPEARMRADHEMLGVAEPDAAVSSAQPAARNRPLPCTAEWFNYVARVGGFADVNALPHAPGSIQWRTLVEERLIPASDRSDKPAELTDWCQWLDNALENR